MSKAVWYFTPTLVTGVLGIVSLPLYTKFLTIEEFGLMELLILLITFLQFGFSFGWDSSFVRFYNDKNYDRQEIFTSVLIFRLLIHTLLIIISFVSLSYLTTLLNIPQEYGFLLKYILFIYIFDEYLKLSLELLRSQNNAKLYGLLLSAKNIIRFIIMLLMFFILKYKLEAVFYSLVFANLFIVVISLKLFKKEYTRMALSTFKIHSKEIVSFGFPLIFASLAFFIINFTDRYMLNWLLPEEIALKDIGLYSFYMKLITATFIFSVIFKILWAPFIYKVHHRLSSPKTFKYIIEIYFVLLVISGFIFSLFSLELIDLISFNSDYLLKYQIVSIIMAIQLLIMIGDYSPVGIGIMKKNKYRAYGGLVFALMNIILNYILIPIYGLGGALIASFSSLLLYFTFLNIMSYSLYRVKYNYMLFIIGILLIMSNYFLSSFSLWNKILILSVFIIFISVYVFFKRNNYIKAIYILRKNRVV